MTKDELFHKNLWLGHEFDLYVLEHPKFAEKIPEDALIVLMPDDDPELAKANLRMAEETHEPGRPMILVRIGKLKPITSRITELEMQIAESY